MARNADPGMVMLGVKYPGSDIRASLLATPHVIAVKDFHESLVPSGARGLFRG